MKDWKKHLDFILLDMVCLYLAFIAAYMTRYGFAWFFKKKIYISLILILTLLNLVLLIVTKTMKNVLRRSAGREFIQTAKHVFLVEFLIISYLFVVKESYFYSRSILGSFAVYYGLLSYVVRMLWKTFLLNRSNRRKTALYIIASENNAKEVIRRYQSDKISHYLMTGVCITDKDKTGEEILGVAVNSNRENVLKFLCREWVDEVAIAVSQKEDSYTDFIQQLIEMGIVVHIEMEETEKFSWAAQEIEKIAGRRVLTVGMNMATPLQACVKRLMDIAGGLAGCLVTLIVLIIFGPVIYHNSPGPIFFAQERIGRNGRKFKMYKFRTMYPDAEERKKELMEQNRVKDGMMFKMDFDPRIIGNKILPDGTKKEGIGSFLRKTSLDELPQSINILRGDMSLVGTRPPTVDEWEKYEPHHRARMSFRPGLTGLWQVSGRSQITDFEEVVKLDTQYIDDWSLGLDIKILLKTVGVVFKDEGAL